MTVIATVVYDALNKNSELSGFALLEVSIALLVLGIISSICITQLSMSQRIYSAQKTQSNIDFVVKAIAVYCLSHDGVLPFPSSTSTNIGFQTESLKDTFGIIPFKSIGVMEKLARDGKGRWLSYRMNPSFGGQTTSIQQKNLGILEFASDIKDDKVAIILKSQDGNVTWYSESSFVSSFMNGFNRQQAPIPTNTIEESF
ncbi:MAG: prepilin-type N-terminal cleavage/methylation domain-containing protein [Holosporales bacterium]|jgi:prepilin-type N-terminal cleavage/methylation domain-containing protein|nr:prepilin-type N-terminal cleavage/methylation domain-containing protein [Holosporales bacterium]